MSRWKRSIATGLSLLLAVSLIPSAGLAFAEERSQEGTDMQGEEPSVTEEQVEQTVEPTQEGGRPSAEGSVEGGGDQDEQKADVSLNPSLLALGGLRSIDALELSGNQAAAVQNASSGSFEDAIPISSLLMLRSGEVTLSNGQTYTLDTNISAASGKAAITVAGGATVTLVVKGSRSLTGGSGYPAIYLPSNSTLILTTEGTETASLNCVGGSVTGPGIGGTAESPTGDQDFRTSGAGGRGGSGVAPGIGGRAGAGGSGGAEKGGQATGGEAGQSGGSGTSCGTLHILGKLTVSARTNTGSLSRPPAGGGAGNGFTRDHGSNGTGAAGGGGSGGVGGGAYGIGGGGAGAGGGASGGTGGFRDRGQAYNADVGGGGGGGAGGSSLDSESGVASGGYGGGGTNSGTRGGTGGNSSGFTGGGGGGAGTGEDRNGAGGGTGGAGGTGGSGGNIYMSRHAVLSTSGCTTTYGMGSSSTVKQNTYTEMRFCTLQLQYTTTPYTGTQRTPSVTVKYNNTTVDPSTYNVEYLNATDAGTATVRVTGKGSVTQANSFGGSNEATFTITKIGDPFSVTTSRASFEYGEQCTLGVKDINSYNKTGITWKVMSGSATLSTTTGTGPVLTPTAKGTVKVRATIPSSANFNEAYAETTITVNARDLSSATSGVQMANISSQVYTGKKITPEPAVTFPTNANTAKRTLVKNTDFTYGYPEANLNQPGGTDHGNPASVTVTGTGNYTGSRKLTFAIEPRDIATGGVTVSQPDNATFTGTEIKRPITVSYGGVTLDASDYNLAYTADLVNAGQKTVTITGTKNLKGTVSKTYTIGKANIADAAVKTAPVDVFFDDKAIESRPALTFNGINLTETGSGGTAANPDDYSLAFSGNREQGTASVTVTGANNFTGTRTLTYAIKARPLYVRALTNQWKYYGTDDYYPNPDTSGGGTEPKYETLVKKLSPDSSAELDEYVPDASYAGANAPAFTGSLSREAGEGTGFYGFLANDLAIPVSASGNNHNYTLKFQLDKTLYPTYQIKDYTVDKPAVLEGTMGKNDWYVGTPVRIVAPEGFLISKSNAYTDDNVWASFITNEDGDYSTPEKARTYYLKNKDTDAITTQCSIRYKQDTHNPTGNIVVGEDAWSNLPDEPGYEVFFNDDVNAGVYADDVMSDVAFVHYFLGEDSATYDRAALAAKPLGEWTEGASVELPIADLNQTKRVLYARVEDQAGNVEFVSTEGIIFDKVTPHLEASYPYDNEWTTKEDPQITGTVYDLDSGLKNRFAAYQAGDEPLQILELGGGSNFAVQNLKDGDYATTIEAWDRAENQASPVTFMVKKDTVEPKLTVSGDTTSIGFEQDVSFAPAVGASGVAKLEARYEDGPWEDVEAGVAVPYTVHENGEYFFRITNGAGVVSQETSIIFTKIDTAAPEVAFAVADEAGDPLADGAWSATGVDVAFSNATANLGTSTFEYWNETDATWNELPAPAPDYTAHVPLIAEEGTHTCRVRITSEAGLSTESSVDVRVDKSAPVANVSVERYEGNDVLSLLSLQQFFNTAVKATAAVSDKPDADASGVASVEHFVLQAPEGQQLDNRPTTPQQIEQAAAGVWTPGEVCTLESDAAYAVYFRLTDHAGNVGYAATDDVVVDSAGPAISFAYDRAGAWDAAPTVAVRVDDGPYGIAEAGYEVDEDGVLTPSDPARFDVTGFTDGTHRLAVHAKDKSGNEASATIEVKKDSGLPAISAALVPESATDESAVVDVTAGYEGPSGLARVEYSIDGRDWVDVTDQVAADGQVTIKENGTYAFRAVTGAGAMSEATVTMDGFVAKTLEPRLEARTVDGEPCESGAVTNQDVTLTFSNALPNVKGIDYWYREVGASDWSELSPVLGYCDVTLSAEGEHAYEFCMSFTDAPDRTEPLSFSVAIDKTNPTGSITLGENTWTAALAALSNGLLFQDSQQIEFAGDDATGTFNSGVQTIEYAVVGAADAAGADTADAVEAVVGDAWTEGAVTQVDPSGAYVAFARITDKAGNRCYLKSDGVTVDNVTPVLEGDVREGSWYTDDTDRLRFVVRDDVSGIAEVKYVLGGDPEQSATLDAENAFTIGIDQLAAGENEVRLTAKDGAGNEYQAGYTVLKDVVKPAVAPVDASGQPDDVVARRDIQVNATAGASGIETVEVKMPNSTTWTNIVADRHYVDTGCYAALEAGTYWFRASNGAGRYSEPQAVTVGNIDSTQPQIAYEVFLAGGEEYTAPDWTTETVFVKFRNTVRHMEGCTYWYQMDDGARQPLEPNDEGDAQFEAIEEGAHDYLIGVTSPYGADSDPLVVQVRRDTTAPSVTVEQSAEPWEQGSTTLAVAAEDVGAGLDEQGAYSYDGGATWTSEPDYVMGTNRDVAVGVRDALGNTAFADVDVLALDNWAPTVLEAQVEQADVVVTQKDVDVVLEDYADASGRPGSGVAEAFVTVDYPYENNALVRTSGANAVPLVRDGGTNEWSTQQPVTAKWDGDNEAWVVALDRVGNARVYGLVLPNMVGTGDEPREEPPVPTDPDDPTIPDDPDDPDDPSKPDPDKPGPDDPGPNDPVIPDDPNKPGPDDPNDPSNPNGSGGSGGGSNGGGSGSGGSGNGGSTADGEESSGSDQVVRPLPQPMPSALWQPQGLLIINESTAARSADARSQKDVKGEGSGSASATTNTTRTSGDGAAYGEEELSKDLTAASEKAGVLGFIWWLPLVVVIGLGAAVAVVALSKSKKRKGAGDGNED